MKTDPAKRALTHLNRLEAESIFILRETVAEASAPVMLYSIGKDSAVMLHLAKKAFFPGPLPFPLLHVDTTWKFRDMYAERDRVAAQPGVELVVYRNPEALDKHGCDAAFGGARRDEEKSRAKERVFSFRDRNHRWDPKRQRPELWSLYNARKNKGESMRVFPLSNWTELDVWQYVLREGIPVVPLYFAAERPTVTRDGLILMVDDERMRLDAGEEIVTRRVRFRTLGCYPLSGAVESDAASVEDIIAEMLASMTSERQGRAIDRDGGSSSMEKKKQEGYF